MKKSKHEKLISMVSHKLKSPLATINLYSEALLSENVGKINNQQREYLEEIHQASAKMVTSVKELIIIISDLKK